jgi:hypothetical protein
MRSANQLACTEFIQQPLFETADEQHGLEESIIVIHDGPIITQGKYMLLI